MALKYKDHIPPFSSERLEAISRVLGDTDRGLTGTELGHALAQNSIGDPTPTMTKWKRLFNALVEFQNREQVGNHVIVLITRTMDPAKYTADIAAFHWRREQLNPILAFAGLTLGEDGKIRRVQAASTLTEALERAGRIQAQLRQRAVHSDVLTFCNAEILAKNYFHAVFEAMKSISAKIRRLSGLTCDGSELVDGAFSGGKAGNPMLAINPLDSDTLKGEQRGFVSLLKGLYGTIRNPLAHNPKIEWDMTEQDALDILTMISLVHRKLDKAHRT
jgi:uncharacterized protein (TIGR02391 family)